MAKAGLFWPCDPAAVQQHGQPSVAFFDRVLADLGDSQSLQQNLSTFSGHIRRIKQVRRVPVQLLVLDACTAASSRRCAVCLFISQ